MINGRELSFRISVHKFSSWKTDRPKSQGKKFMLEHMYKQDAVGAYIWVWSHYGCFEHALLQHSEPQALATKIWGKICPPSDQEAIV